MYGPNHSQRNIGCRHTSASEPCLPWISPCSWLTTSYSQAIDYAGEYPVHTCRQMTAAHCRCSTHGDRDSAGVQGGLAWNPLGSSPGVFVTTWTGIPEACGTCTSAVLQAMWASLPIHSPHCRWVHWIFIPDGAFFTTWKAPRERRRKGNLGQICSHGQSLIYYVLHITAHWVPPVWQRLGQRPPLCSLVLVLWC